MQKPTSGLVACLFEKLSKSLMVAVALESLTMATVPEAHPLNMGACMGTWRAQMPLNHMVAIRMGQIPIGVFGHLHLTLDRK